MRYALSIDWLQFFCVCGRGRFMESEPYNETLDSPLPKSRKLQVLIACEESQKACKAFRELGHNAFSCDLQDCSGGLPEFHLRGDVRQLIGFN